MVVPAGSPPLSPAAAPASKPPPLPATPGQPASTPPAPLPSQSSGSSLASAPPPLPQDPAADHPEWYVHSYDGNQYGPVSKAELASWVEDGSITPNCQVLREGEGNWKRAGEVFSLAGSSSGPGTAAPAPAPTASPTGLGAFDGRTFNHSQVQMVPASALGKHHHKHLQWAHKVADKECAKIGNLRVTNVAGIPLDESKGKGFWGQVNIMWARSSTVQPDLMSVVEVSEPSGDFFIVAPRERSFNLPHEFASVVPGRLPVPLALGRGAMGRWSRGNWATPDQVPGAVLSQAAKDHKMLSDGIKWDWVKTTANSTTTIKLPWTIQAVPLGESHFLFLVQSVMRGLPPKFGIQWFLQRRAAFANFVATAGPSTPGNCPPMFCYPTDTVIPLILKYGETIANGHRF